MKKILSLAITLMLVLSVASIPAMAATLSGGPYVGDLTTYGYEAFKADFDAATYTAFEDFEQLPDGLSAVTGYNNLSSISPAVYPFEMAVPGVENGSFSLKLNDASGKNLIFAFDVQNGGAGDTTSGNYAIIGGKDTGSNNAVVEFVAGDSEGAYNVLKADGVAQTDYKISAIGFALTYGTARQAMTLTLTYDNGDTETVSAASPASGTRGAYSFCAVKAPAGKYITGLKIAPNQNASFIIDNLGIIFDKEEEPEESAGLPGGPYEGDLTAYGYNAFKADFNAATYTAFEDFEQLPDGLNAVTGYNNLSSTSPAVYPFEMAVSGVENGSFSLKLNDASGKNLIFAFDVQNGGAGDTTSGNYAIIGGKDTGSNNAVVEFVAGDSEGAYNVLKADGVAQTDYKISAIGFALTYGTARQAMTLTLTYDNGDTETVSAASPASGTRGAYSFCAVKAPAGKYITGLKIAPNQNASFIIDNLGIIFDKEEEPEDITFSTDAAGENIISSVAGLTGDVYVNIAAYAFEDKKVLLALYGAGDELLDVAIANVGDTQALAQVPAGKTLTGIKAFVWDIAKLIPAQAPVEINE